LGAWSATLGEVAVRSRPVFYRRSIIPAFKLRCRRFRSMGLLGPCGAEQSMPSRDLVPIAGNRSGFPSKARQQATNRQRLRPVSILLGYIRTSLLPAHSSIILPTLCRKPAEATSQRHPSGDALSSSCPQLLASMHISMFLATSWLSKTG
jgi:hypothetical protein